MIESHAQVGDFLPDSVEPACLVLVDVRLGFLGQGEKVLGLAAPQLVRLTRGLELLERVLADRLEHPDAIRLADADEALVDERLKRVEVGIADRFGSLERAAAGEDPEAGEEALLVRVQKLVRPPDGSPQRLLTRIYAAAGPEQVEAAGEPLEKPGRGEQPNARGGELECERQLFQPRAELGHGLVRLEARVGLPGTRQEELHSIVGLERRHGVSLLARQA